MARITATRLANIKKAILEMLSDGRDLYDRKYHPEAPAKPVTDRDSARKASRNVETINRELGERFGLVVSDYAVRKALTALEESDDVRSSGGGSGRRAAEYRLTVEADRAERAAWLEKERRTEAVIAALAGAGLESAEDGYGRSGTVKISLDDAEALVERLQRLCSHPSRSFGSYDDDGNAVPSRCNHCGLVIDKPIN
jgi:hypothetical protein